MVELKEWCYDDFPNPNFLLDVFSQVITEEISNYLFQLQLLQHAASWEMASITGNSAKAIMPYMIAKLKSAQSPVADKDNWLVTTLHSTTTPLSRAMFAS